ncbi:hypothetical protein PaeCFBP13512_22225 [Paenibacillus sp. CFBP13512]|nr:hypothetical protein PaeCFBP13512_22225 [Paenibacillus sp. CFBP13512]
MHLINDIDTHIQNEHEYRNITYYVHFKIDSLQRMLEVNEIQLYSSIISKKITGTTVKFLMIFKNTNKIIKIQLEKRDFDYS